MRIAVWLAAAVVALTSPAPADAADLSTTGGVTFHHAYAVVYIDGSRLTPGWPYYVRWASDQWAGSGVSVRYAPCRPGTGCVHVLDGHYGTAQPGVTYFGWYVGTTVLAEPVTTRINLDYRWRWHDRYQAACHEVGRGLGIEWAYLYWEGSCMFRRLDGGASVYPAQRDRDALARAYGPKT